jgi:hypothetical protein
MGKTDELRTELNDLMMNNFVIPEREPQYLYHYTPTLDSAKSIIETGQFWVSDAFTTTDENEIIHIRNIMEEILKDDYSIKKSKMQYCLDFFDRACEVSNQSIFILCFSVDKNSKYLWDNCASNGACLRFKFDSITPALHEELDGQYRYFVDKNGVNVRIKILNPNHLVSYDNGYKKERIKRYLDIIFRCIVDLPEYDFDEKQYEAEVNLLSDIYTDILLFSCFTKDNQLYVEKEYRLLYLFHDISILSPILKTRMRDDKEIRYVSMNMKANNTFPLDRVFIETKNVKKNNKDIKYSLKKAGFFNVNIKEVKMNNI